MDIPGNVSKSWLADLERCPYRAYWLKRLKLEAPESYVGGLGREVHEACADILLGQEPALIVAKVSHDAERYVQTFITRVLPTLPPGERLVEVPVEAEFEGVPIKGIMDLVVVTPDLIHIYDWKTQEFARTSETERILYGWLARATWGPRNVRFCYGWLHGGSITPWLYEWSAEGLARHLDITYDTQLTLTSATYFEQGLSDLLSRVTAARPDPRPGPHCRNYYGQPCTFWLRGCPIADRLDEYYRVSLAMDDGGQAFGNLVRTHAPPGVMSEDTARHSLQALLGVEADVQHAREALRQYCREQGSIRVGLTTYGWRTKKRLIPRKADVLRSLHEQGYTWEEIALCLNMSETSLRHLGKRRFGSLSDDIAFLLCDQEDVEEWGPVD